MSTRRTGVTEPVDPVVERANRYHAYMEGWRDGAGIRAMRSEFDGHRLRVDYEDGYAAGAKARSVARDEASARYHHEPSIMRLQDDGGVR